MSVPFVVSGQSFTFVANGQPHSIGTTHPNYQKIKELLATATEEELIALSDIPKAVQNFCAGRAEIRDGDVFYDGKPLHSVLTTRILELMDSGFPFEPMLKFLENLMQNPSAQSVEELYEFLSHKGLPITEDGMVLGYKVVRPDYTDKHSGTVDNHPGQTIEMLRNQVDDRRENTCSYGLI